MRLGRAGLIVVALGIGGAGASSAQDVSDELANSILTCAAMYTAEEFAKYPTGVPENRAGRMNDAFNVVIPYDTLETENAFVERFDIARGEFMELFYDNEGLDVNMPASLEQIIALCDETFAEVLARGIE